MRGFSGRINWRGWVLLQSERAPSSRGHQVKRSERKSCCPAACLCLLLVRASILLLRLSFANIRTQLLCPTTVERLAGTLQMSAPDWDCHTSSPLDRAPADCSASPAYRQTAVVPPPSSCCIRQTSWSSFVVNCGPLSSVPLEQCFSTFLLLGHFNV